MDRTDGIIRKITIGNDLKTGMNYVVGSVIGDMTISSIDEDVYDNFFLQTKSYIIYVTKDGINEQVWKKIDKLPVVIEYKL